VNGAEFAAQIVPRGMDQERADVAREFEAAVAELAIRRAADAEEYRAAMKQLTRSGTT
jgi:hypothetical protein